MSLPTERRASCSCGALALTVRGAPVRVSICHCLLCQKRTGSTYGVQARFAEDQVVAREGSASTYSRVGDSGGAITFSFCPTCATIVHFEVDRLPGFVVVPVGAFADPSFPAPTLSIYGTRRHPWVSTEGIPIEHHD